MAYFTLKKKAVILQVKTDIATLNCHENVRKTTRI
jgi:hypothetical protein